MKVYTKTGDKGLTRTALGVEVFKDDCLIETNGVIDELMSSIDRVIYGLDIIPNVEESLNNCIKIQTRLKQLGGEISGKKVAFPITEEDVNELENNIDDLHVAVHEFVRFSNPIAMDIDEARVRTRRAERTFTEFFKNNKISSPAYKYMNRLSDYFFVLAVFIDNKFR